MLRPLWLAALFTLSLSLPAADSAAGGDGGSPGDAPDDRASALTLTPGVYTGWLHASDQDWYRVVSQDIVRVVSTGATLWMEDENGTYIGGGSDARGADPAGGSIYLRFIHSEESQYAFEITVEALADGGEAGDAPAEIAAARHASLLTQSCGFAHAYDADVFLVQATPGHAFSVDVRFPGTVSLMDSAGRVLAGGFAPSGPVESIVPTDGQVAILFRSTNINAAYCFTPVERHAPDLRIENIRIEQDQTSLRPVYHVTFEVVNAGLGAGAAWGWNVRTAADNFAYRALGSGFEPELQPGARRVIALDWHATGQLGPQEVRFFIFSGVDLDPRNNVATETHDVLVNPPVGEVGVDVLNVNVACVGVSSDGRRHGLACQAPLVDEDALLK